MTDVIEELTAEQLYLGGATYQTDPPCEIDVGTWVAFVSASTQRHPHAPIFVLLKNGRELQLPRTHRLRLRRPLATDDLTGPPDAGLTLATPERLKPDELAALLTAAHDADTAAVPAPARALVRHTFRHALQYILQQLEDRDLVVTRR